jgi:uncharacterized RDD family membrane protein YckC
MQTVSVQTAQNVAIDYEIASVGERILATLVDFAIIIAYGLGLFIGYSYTSGYEFMKEYWGLLALIASVPVFFYDFICETAMNGQSFGKKLIRIKVVKLDGTQPSVGSYLLRWLLRSVDIYFFTGAVALLTILISGKGQRVGDIAAGTTVIRLKQSVKMGDTILVHVDENYRPAFPSASRLDDRTMTIVKEVLDFEKKNRNTGSSRKILESTKVRLEAKLGVSAAGLEPRLFLETLLKDYNYYQRKTGLV